MLVSKPAPGVCGLYGLPATPKKKKKKEEDNNIINILNKTLKAPN